MAVATVNEANKACLDACAECQQACEACDYNCCANDAGMADCGRGRIGQDSHPCRRSTD